MARVILELTNRCNLRCVHCYDERHAGTHDLPVEVLDTVLKDASDFGIDHICFSGGEPTLHRLFRGLIERVCDAGYTFSFVTNGFRFKELRPFLRQHRERLGGITFSLDGPDEATHDRIRGDGSFRQVMRAATVAFFEALPFTINCVLTRGNAGQVAQMIELAARLGSRGIRFGHLLSAPETTPDALALSPTERLDVEARIRQLEGTAPVPVTLAPGHFSASPFFLCPPLALEEFNVDCRGNLTLCCHLSGFPGGQGGNDVIGNLLEIPLATALDRFRARVDRYRDDKRACVERGSFGGVDHFPCCYCVKYMAAATRRPHVYPVHVQRPARS